nr:MAG: capsid protein [Crogonang virus 1]
MTPASAGLGFSGPTHPRIIEEGEQNENIETSYVHLLSKTHDIPGVLVYPGSKKTIIENRAEEAIAPFAFEKQLGKELAREYAAFFYTGGEYHSRSQGGLRLARSIYLYFAGHKVNSLSPQLRRLAPPASKTLAEDNTPSVQLLDVDTLTLASVCNEMSLMFHQTLETCTRNYNYARTKHVSTNSSKSKHATPFAFIIARALLGVESSLQAKLLARKLKKFPYGSNTVTIEYVPHGYTAEEILWMWALLHVDDPHYDAVRIWLQAQTCIRQHNPIDAVWLMTSIEKSLVEELNLIDYLPFLEPLAEGDMDVDNTIVTHLPPSQPPADSAGSTGVNTETADNTAIETGTEDVQANVVEEEATLDEICDTVEDIPAVVPVLEHRFGKVINANMSTATLPGAQFLNIVLPQTALRALDSTPQALLFKQEAYVMLSMKIKIVSNCSKFQQGAALASFLYAQTQRDFNTDLLNLKTLFTAPRIMLNGSFATSGEMHVPFEHPQPLIATIQNSWTTDLDVGNLVLTCVDPVANAAGSSTVINYVVYVCFEMCKLFGKRGFYTPWVPIPCVAPAQGDGDWSRDLTCEGIEPNPGPVMSGSLAVIMKKAVFTRIAKPVVGRLKDMALSAVNEAEHKLLGCLGEDADRDKPSLLTSDPVFMTTMHSISSGVGAYHVKTHRLDPAGTTIHPKDYVGVDRKFQHGRVKTMYGLQEIFEWPATAVVNTRLWSTRVQPGQYIQTITGGLLTQTTSNTPVDFLADNYECYRGSLRYKFTIVATGMHTGKLRVTFEPEVQQTNACDNQGVKFEVFELGADLDGNVTYGFDVPYQSLLLMQPLTEANAMIKGGRRLLSGVLSVFVENPLVAPSTVSNRVRVIVEKRGYDNFETAVPGPMKTRFTSVESNTFVNRIALTFSLAQGSSIFTISRSDGGPISPANATFLRPNPNFAARVTISSASPIKWDVQNVVQATREIFIYDEGSDRIIYRILPNSNSSNRRDGYQAGADVSYGCSFFEGGFWNAGPLIPLTITVAFIAIPAASIRGDMDSRFDEPTHMTNTKKSDMITPIQVGEDHMKIKAMLRRCEFWYKFTTFAVEDVVPSLANVSIPCSFGSPVNRALAEEYMKYNKLTSYHDVYRFSRGGVRFVLAFYATEGSVRDCLVQTTHIPFESPTVSTENQFGSVPNNALGYATEIHSLDKNPVISIEIPNYLLGRKNYNSSYTVSELLTRMMNALGNLKIVVMGPKTTKVKCIVYRSIGDDLLFSVLNGLPNRVVDGIPFIPYVGNTRPFPVTPAAQTSNDGWVRDLTEEGVEPNPGPFLGRSTGFSLLGSDFAHTMTKIGNNVDKVGNLAEAIESIVRKDERLVAYVDILLQVGHVLINPNIKTFALAMTSIILKVIPTVLMKELGSRVSSFCTKLFRSSNMEGNLDSNGKNMADDIWDCIGEFFNVRPNIRNSWVRKFNLIMRLTSMADKIVSFIESVLFAFKVFLNKMYQLYDKDTYLFKTIMDSEVIKCITGYNNLVSQLTDPAIFRHITSSKKNISFCYTTRRYGKVIANNLLLTRKLNPTLHTSVIRSNADMDKLCARLLAFADRPLVRREPFSVYMFGNAGIGKSYTSNRLIMALLKGAGIPITDNPIFVKASGTKYMDGYQDQPAFLYDDFCAINDAEGTEFGEFIALKSSNFYQGNFSSIDDKQRPVHPALLFTCSNIACPDSNVVQTQEAFLRRRDVLVRAELSPKFQHCDEHQTQHMGLGCTLCFNKNSELIKEGMHVRFVKCNPMNGSASPITYTGLKNFEKYIASAHKKYYDRETQNMMARLNALNAAIDACEKPNVYGTLDKGTSITQEMLVAQLESHSLNIKIDQEFVQVFDRLLQTNNFAMVESRVLSNEKFRDCQEVFDSAGDFFGQAKTGDGFGKVAVGVAAVGCAAAGRYGYTMYKRATRVKPKIPCICSLTYALEAIRPRIEQHLNIKDIFEFKTQLDAEAGTSASYDAIYTIPDDNVEVQEPQEPSLTEENSCSIPEQLETRVDCRNGFFIVNGVKYLIECDECVATMDKSYMESRYGCSLECCCVCSNSEWLKSNVEMAFQSGRYLYFKDSNNKADGFVARKIMCNTCSQDPQYVNKLMMMGIKHGYGGAKNDQELATFDIVKAIAWAIGTVSAIIYALKILAWIYNLIFPTCGNSGPDGDYASERRRQVAQKRLLKKENKRARKYMRTHQGNSDFDIAAIYKKNIVHLDAGGYKTRGVAVAGTNVLTTGHWYEEFVRNGSCTVDGGKEISCDDVDAKKLSMQYEGEEKFADIVMLKFHSFIPSKRNIVHHFITEDELERETVPQRVQYEDARSTRSIMGLPITETFHSCYYNGGDRFISGWEYDFNNVGVDYEVYNGGCMSALIDGIHKQIIGFHVASGPKKILQRHGYAQCITRECLQDLLGVDSVKECEYVDLNYLYAEDFDASLKTEPMLALKPYISVQASLKEPIRHVTFTDLRPSPMFGVLTTNGKKPVVFQTHGEAFPGIAKMEEAINKNSTDVKIPPKWSNKARNALKHAILKIVPTYKVKQSRTTTECIDGVIGMEFMRPQISNSANGIPLRELFPAKKDTYKRAGKNLFLNTIVVDLHERNMAMRYKGECPPTAFQVVLKDELKSEEKMNSPREVDCSPTEYTHAVRKYTLDFSSAFYENNMKTFSAVGMNCLGSDWQRLVAKLRWKDNIIAGDVSAFGPTLSHVICENVWIAINHWYDNFAENRDQQSNFIRNVLSKEATTSVKVAYNTVFKTNASSPSGLGITTIVNTCSMWQYLYIAWCAIAEHWYSEGKTVEDIDLVEIQTVETFEQYVDTVIYGDDLICSVSPVVKQMFNNLTLANFFKTIGLKYTDGTKQQVSVPFVELHQATFLGRAFSKLQVDDDEYDVGALDQTLIQNIVNWTKCRNPKNINRHMLSATQSALIESMYHGPAIHNKVFGLLQKYWLDEGRNEILVGYTFDELFERWLNNKIRDDEKLTLDCGDKCMSIYDYEQSTRERSVPSDHESEDEQNTPDMGRVSSSI